MTYEYKATVKSVSATRKVGQNGFEIRELVTTTGGQCPNVNRFDFKKDRVKMLDGLREGDEVTVKFGLSGREWKNPSTGKTSIFNTLDGISVTVDSAAEPKPVETDAAGTVNGVDPDNGDDGLPF